MTRRCSPTCKKVLQRLELAMHNSLTTGGSVGAASRPLACVFPGNRTGEPPPVNAVEGPSAFLAPESGRLWLRAKAQQAHARGGFWRKRIARGCRSKAGRRIRRRAPLDRPTQCSDAAAPVSKDAGFPCEGLALLRPLRCPPESKNDPLPRHTMWRKPPRRSTVSAAVWVRQPIQETIECFI